MKTPIQDFYSSSPIHQSFADGIRLVDTASNVPDDWFVIITDVVQSTQAIARGEYKTVNVAGALPIIALGRVYGTLQRPFVFGGDGMIFLVGPDKIDEARAVISRVIRDVRDFFNLNLRAAAFPVGMLRSKGGTLSLTRVTVSEHYTQAFFHGSVPSIAEDMLKSGNIAEYAIPVAQDDTSVNYDGFTCRWADVPSHRGKTIALIVEPKVPENGRQSGSSADLYETILTILGADHHPLKKSHMTMGGPNSNWKVQSYIMNRGRRNLSYHLYNIKEWFMVQLIKLFAALNIPIKQGIYQVNKLHEMNIANSDYRKIEGGLKMIAAVDDRSVENLKGFLEEEYRAGRLVYGLHVGENAHMTCIATVETGDDIHFLDATGGGYALAATDLKQRRASSSSTSEVG